MQGFAHHQLTQQVAFFVAGKPLRLGTCVCMEASGDFQEAVARFLHEEDYRVSVINARRIKGYAASQLQRTKTDAADAALIARFGGGKT
jgi:transposase